MFKRLQIILIPLFALLIFSSTSLAQQAEWRYKNKIEFPAADTQYVQPYLCTVDASDRLFVISSKVTRLSARNAIFYADSNDTEFTKMVDYFENGEEDTLVGRVAQLLGITAVDNDIVVSTRIPSQQVPAGASAGFYYDDADTTNPFVFGFNIQGAGWGTTVLGLAATKDSIIMGAIPYQGPSFRFYNFTQSLPSPGYASWFLMGSQPLEPGGPPLSGAFDMIRDMATLPDGDYYNTSTVFYSSRNSATSTSLNGGIAVWEGGSINDPSSYTGQRVTDATGLLNLDASLPYGISVDNQNILWVAGIDSLRRWVKGFELLGAFANVIDELPSQNSFDNPDPNGAPMISPCDVAFSSDGKTAYVIDAVARCAYKFKFESTTDVDDENNMPVAFGLDQNFPNPFNPSTMISFTIPKSDNVKLIVTNSLGEVVSELVNGYMNSGQHNVAFNGEGLSSGIYYYTLTTNGQQISKKMMLLK